MGLPTELDTYKLVSFLYEPSASSLYDDYGLETEIKERPLGMRVDELSDYSDLSDRLAELNKVITIGFMILHIITFGWYGEEVMQERKELKASINKLMGDAPVQKSYEKFVPAEPSDDEIYSHYMNVIEKDESFRTEYEAKIAAETAEAEAKRNADTRKYIKNVSSSVNRFKSTAYFEGLKPAIDSVNSDSLEDAKYLGFMENLYLLADLMVNEFGVKEARKEFGSDLQELHDHFMGMEYVVIGDKVSFGDHLNRANEILDNLRTKGITYVFNDSSHPKHQDAVKYLVNQISHVVKSFAVV